MRVPHELLRETVVIEDFEGSGARGPAYAAARSVRASVQHTKRVLADQKGNQVTIDALVIVRPESGPVRPESRLVWNGETYRVDSCYPMPDSRRPSHYEIAITRFLR